MWTLVIFYFSSSVSFATIPGFTSHDSCHKASLELKESRQSIHWGEFTCVEVK